jgi:sterol desaturase/sphingolipid hydroxylase (fatty acid hydroxylase superfamily)
MLTEALDGLQSWMPAGMPDLPRWLAVALSAMLEFFRVSFIDAGGRYYWITIVESLVVLAVAYVLWGGLRVTGVFGFFRFCVPKGYFRHPSTMLDLQLNVANHFIGPFVNVFWRLNAAFFVAVVLGWMVKAFGPAPHLFAWHTGGLILFTLVVAIADDFGYWVWHYLAHKVPFLWAFHKVHHSAEVLTPLVAGRVHPVETMLLPVFRTAAASVVAAPALYFFVGEPHLVTVFGLTLLAAAFGAAGAQLFHAHVPISWGSRLNRVFVSPATHQIHHSIERRHWDKNMGAYLAVWDWMFGTLYLPEPGQKITYGVRDDMPQVHTSLPVAYLLPFWEALPLRRRLLAGLAGVVPGVRAFAARYAPEPPSLPAGAGVDGLTNQS